jgi:hypothetical protein
MDWIYLAQHRGQWRALVNMVMNLWVPENGEKLSHVDLDLPQQHRMT